MTYKLEYNQVTKKPTPREDAVSLGGDVCCIRFPDVKTTLQTLEAHIEMSQRKVYTWNPRADGPYTREC